MNIKKKLIVLFIVVIAALIFLPNKVSAMTATEMKNKLDDIRYNDSELKDGAYYNGYYYGSTCYAFANKVAYRLFGSSHYDGGDAWEAVYNLDNLCIGDVIEYYEPLSSSGLHCFIVTDLDGENITVTDSNWKAYTNTWARGITNKTDIYSNGLKVVWHYKDNNIKSFNTDTQNPTIVEMGYDMSSITSTSFKVRVKATDNVSVTRAGFNIWAGENDYVWVEATYNSSTGYWEYNVNKSNFKNATGLYQIHAYVFDAAGNSVGSSCSPFPMGTTIATNLGNFTARIALKSNSNYVVGVNGTSNQSNVLLKTKSETDYSQIWEFTKNSDNTYTIINAVSGKALDINNSANDNGTNVEIYQSASTNNQKFYIMNYNGGYRLVPKSSKDLKSLDNIDGKVENGNNIVLYQTYSINNNAQTWTFQKVTGLPFKDVDYSDWFYGAVDYTYNKGIISGYNSTTFAPYNKLSRAMLVTILWRMEGAPKTNYNKFPDVKSSDWYYTAVNWAASKEIVNGYGSGKFGPNDNVTREQLCSILMNYARYKGKKVNARANTSNFMDFNQTASYFQNAVSWCIANEIISGKSNGTKIDPKGTATRAEAVAMIRTYCLNIK